MTNSISTASIGNALKSYAKSSADRSNSENAVVSRNKVRRDTFRNSKSPSSNNSAVIKSIYRRMTSGAKVSAADEKKLKELDPKMYSAAKNAQMKAANTSVGNSSVNEKKTLDTRA